MGQVLSAASVIAQERVQKRSLIQNLKTGALYLCSSPPFPAHCVTRDFITGLASDPARQRALLQPFVDEARSMGLSHDIVDAAQAKLKVVRNTALRVFEDIS